MESVKQMLATYPFVICVLIMLLSEFAKHMVEGVTKNVWFRFQHGGTPSSHSAFVASLMMITGHINGINSTQFATATEIASIVWYDAAFVRKQVGKQAKALNILQQFEEFSERVGHSLMEVIVGIVFGVVLTQILLMWIA